MNTKSGELVSIVIPVYNTQDYLERCISSALNQTHQNMQIILINDGSTDNSGAMCDAYAEIDSRVEVIHQENAGQSAARNIGLDKINGQWVTFLDSDDYISKHFVEINLAACLQHNADISVSGHVIDYNGNICEDGFDKSTQVECITNREAVIRHFSKKGALFNMACGKLYRVSLWNDLRFPVGKMWEDLFISHRVLYTSERVAVLDVRLYAYYMAPGSLMRKPFNIKRLDALDAWSESIRFYEHANEPEFADIAQRIYCNRLFDAYGMCRKLLPDESEIHKQLRRQAIATYKKVKRIRSYIDCSLSKTYAYRMKQIIGRYFPALYIAIFLRKPNWTI